MYCFLSNRTGDIRFDNPIFMEQAQPKDNIFSTQGDASSKRLGTVSRNTQLSLEKDKNKNNKM